MEILELTSAESKGRPTEDSRAVHLDLVVGGSRVPLGFVRRDAVVYLVARDRSARWPVEVLRDGTARLDLGDGPVDGSTTLVVEPGQKEEVLELFRTKYGPAGFERWYKNPARILEVRLDHAPASQSPSGYHRWLESEFDNVADDYDRHILGNRINRLLRDRSLALLRTTFARSRRLLEIGCGSGMETLPLLLDGHEVLCVDISDRMLEVVRSKARREGVSERLTTSRLPASDVGRLLPEHGPGSFHGAYSTYGALNCEADLGPLPPALHGLLAGDGRFVAGVYNRWCVDELVGYLLAGQWQRAFGRVAHPVRVGSSRFCVDVFSYSPRSFAGAFAPWFRPERWEAAPALLPPSDLVGYAEKYSRHFDRLDRWDRYLFRRRPFRSLGDHFLMTFRRAPNGSGPPAEFQAAVRTPVRPAPVDGRKRGR